MKLRYFFIAFTSIVLQACGGGGGGGTATVTTGTSDKPDLVLTEFNAPASATAGNTISISMKLMNQGNAKAADPANTIPVGIYLSQDNEIDPLVDLFVGFTDPTGHTGLDKGSTVSKTATVTLPTSVGSGIYYIGAYADPRHVAKEYIVTNFPSLPDLSIYESDEANNNITAPSTINIIGSGVCTDDGYEDDDSTGQNLSLSVAENHNFCYDHKDLFLFSGVISNTYKVSVTGLDNTHVTLLDADGNIVNTAYESSSKTELIWTADKTQKYTIEVSAASLRKGNLIKDPMGLGSDYSIIIE